MIPLLLSDIANAVKGKIIDGQHKAETLTIDKVTTDSRALVEGDLFIALKGPTFDGHRFSEKVAELGCSALIVEHPQNVQIPQIIVKDTHRALGQLSAYVKQQVAPKTVAITGSSGKTTVKEMVAAILMRLGNVLATQGSFNNDIGVPLTLLRLEHNHDFAVVELGASHIGEIAYTVELVKPDVAIINNVAAAHLEGFGDLCGVARAKGEIFEGLAANGVAIYNQDSKYANKWQWRFTDKTVRRFSCKDQSDCFSTDIVLDENGYASFKLNTYVGNTFIELTVPGQHNVCNAVAAAIIAIEFGAGLDDIRLGLAEMMPVKGRMNLHHLSNNFKLIDDSYNANVESIKAAIDLLASYSGRRVLILGDMGELGHQARSYHHEVGEYAKTKNIDNLLSLGVLSQSTSDGFNSPSNGQTSGEHFSSREKLMKSLAVMLESEEQQISILVKGSRSAHMEYVVKDITDWQNNTKTEGQS
ncbi:MAG: UDP-N-acetylmuramoyl-tripeptide--D-alanyl-D-alanine ligase [Alteromonadaceae bacterium]|nr:UDP-N-acetylmuramoyl-tripeptide--D-alanyl-D-alanine ligase [Alteromonadaceae bacterium]